MELILSCVPVLDTRNLEYAQSLGMPRDFPWLAPYRGSRKGVCARHGGEVWIGPAQQEQLSKIPKKNRLILCHFCAIVYADELGADINLVSLSDSETDII